MELTKGKDLETSQKISAHKKLIYVREFFFLFILLISFSCRAGQETWGGDAASLKFVKYGRILNYEEKNTPECHLSSILSEEKFQQLIDNTEVQSVEKDRVDSKDKIYFNRLTWWSLSKKTKAAIALQKYAAQAKVVISLEKAEMLVKECSGLKFWQRNSNLQTSEVQVNPPSIVHDVLLQSKELLKFLKSEEFSKSIPGLDLDKMSDIIEEFDRQKNHPKFQVGIHEEPVVFLFPENMIKDAKNMKSGHKKEISINKSLWKTLSRGQKRELLLHEYLGLMSINDHNYQHSSKLFFYLSDEDFDL